ncbi:MAG: hydrogenase nickel incorporation protein HypB [Thermoanaerobacteraceae bacterium]|nr:hydrogenase nickel incorporation protein HypB [Thermoanaerobacteraceae bacterium]
MEIKVIKDVLEANNYIARKIRDDLTKRQVMMINIIGSPGAGKTSFIIKTIQHLDIKSVVIEGDVTSDIDSRKVADFGIPVVQVNTGGGCHLNANMIDLALEEISAENAIIFVENVGNLICPASFDIGEDFKLVISSIPEGHDKPYKYPGIFEKAKATILNKIDLMKYVDFNKNSFYEGVKTLNPNGYIFEVSSILGDGIREWTQWLKLQFMEKFNR